MVLWTTIGSLVGILRYIGSIRRRMACLALADLGAPTRAARYMYILYIVYWPIGPAHCLCGAPATEISDNQRAEFITPLTMGVPNR